MEVLQLLIQYPYSRITEEPDFDHIKDSVRKSMNPELYHASELVSLPLSPCHFDYLTWYNSCGACTDTFNIS